MRPVTGVAAVGSDVESWRARRAACSAGGGLSAVAQPASAELTPPSPSSSADRSNVRRLGVSRLASSVDRR